MPGFISQSLSAYGVLGFDMTGHLQDQMVRGRHVGDSQTARDHDRPVHLIIQEKLAAKISGSSALTPVRRQGPEDSSGRLERYPRLCRNKGRSVPTTPARICTTPSAGQRRSPAIIVMTQKRLLRCRPPFGHVGTRIRRRPIVIDDPRTATSRSRVVI